MSVVRRISPAVDAGTPVRATWTSRTLLVIGSVHLAMAPLLYSDQLTDIISGGVLGQVESDAALKAERSDAFWYTTAGFSTLLLAGLVRSLERSSVGVPRYLPAALAGIAVWGVALMPMSGFWAFLVPAALAWKARSHR